jgi:hypothetical protein
MDFRGRFNAIISEHKASIESSQLRRENVDERQLGTVLHKLIKEFSPETLQSFQNDQSDGFHDRQKQEKDNDRLIEHLLENDKKLTELARIEQENYARYQQHLLDYDDRLAAFIRFQEHQEERKARSTQEHHEHLMSLIRVQENQERRDGRSEQLLQHVQQLTELVIQQQQQHARDTQALHQLVHRSLDNNELVKRVHEQSTTSSGTQQQQGYQFNIDLFNKLVQTIVLLWTLIIVLKK